MATKEQRDRLLAVACPWCGASINEECTVASVRANRTVRRITTLDGGAHDARWQAALNRAAPVLGQAVRAAS